MAVPFANGRNSLRMPPSRSPDPITAPVIAIDGPSGAGKSTIARLLAERLGIPYLDTGAMYRAVALMALRDGLTPPLDAADTDRVVAMAERHEITIEPDGSSVRVLVDGEDVSTRIRTPECALMASAVSALPGVRRALVPVQRTIGLERGCVMEGRDIGSVVFPDATLKVFLTANPDERARRRLRDLESAGVGTSLDQVLRQQERRDRQDSTREDSPLTIVPGAVVVDTTSMTLDEVVTRLLEELRTRAGDLLDTNGEDTIRSRNHGGLGRGRSAPIEEESS
jgi:cytidylate kinase